MHPLNLSPKYLPPVEDSSLSVNAVVAYLAYRANCSRNPASLGTLRLGLSGVSWLAGWLRPSSMVPASQAQGDRSYWQIGPNTDILKGPFLRRMRAGAVSQHLLLNLDVLVRDLLPGTSPVDGIQWHAIVHLTVNLVRIHLKIYDLNCSSKLATQPANAFHVLAGWLTAVRLLPLDITFTVYIYILTSSSILHVHDHRPVTASFTTDKEKRYLVRPASESIPLMTPNT